MPQVELSQGCRLPRCQGAKAHITPELDTPPTGNTCFPEVFFLSCHRLSYRKGAACLACPSVQGPMHTSPQSWTHHHLAAPGPYCFPDIFLLSCHRWSFRKRAACLACPGRTEPKLRWLRASCPTCKRTPQSRLTSRPHLSHQAQIL